MSEVNNSLISEYTSINADETLSKAVELFDKTIREILVFGDNESFLGYLTKRFLTRQSKIHLDSKVLKFVKRVPTVQKSLSLDAIARSILSKKIRSVPVEESGKIIGIFRDINVIEAAKNLFEGKTVQDVMTRNPITVNTTTTAAQLVTTSRNFNISRSPVVDDDGKLVGIVSPHDFTQILMAESPGQTQGDRSASIVDPLGITVTNIMTEGVVSCKKDDQVLDAIEKLLSTDHKALVVIDEGEHPVGILTTRDLLETVSVPPKTEGYYVNILGEVSDEDMEQVIEMGVEIVKKYADMIGSSGQLYIHSKVIPKKKFRGFTLYHIRIRIASDTGKTYVARSEGYGLFGALAVAIDRVEREIVSEREKAQQTKHRQVSTRYLIDELEELDEL